MRLPFKTEEAKYAWLAGIVDSEGSITFQRRWTPKISIYNSHQEFLETIKSTFDLENLKLSRPEGHGRWGNQPQFGLNVHGNRLRKIIHHILPFLIIKKEQAEIAIKLLDLTKDWRDFVKQYGMDVYRKTCMAYYQEIKHLNSLRRAGDKPQVGVYVSSQRASREEFTAMPT